MAGCGVGQGLGLGWGILMMLLGAATWCVALREQQHRLQRAEEIRLANRKSGSGLRGS